MNNSSSQTGGRRRRRTTLVLIAVGGASLAAALLIGIADNPPGLLLVYLAVAAGILAFAHHWRRVKCFLILLGASLIGFPLAVVLHNAFYALAEITSDIVVLPHVLGFLEVAFFLLAVLVCPPGILIGALGSIAVALWRSRRRPKNPDSPTP
jgi:hypothetical protein